MGENQPANAASSGAAEVGLEESTEAGRAGDFTQLGHRMRIGRFVSNRLAAGALLMTVVFPRLSGSPFQPFGTTVGTSGCQRSRILRNVRWLRHFAAGLENRYARKGIESSNLSFSASVS